MAQLTLHAAGFIDHRFKRSAIATNRNVHWRSGEIRAMENDAPQSIAAPVSVWQIRTFNHPAIVADVRDNAPTIPSVVNCELDNHAAQIHSLRF